MVADGRAALYHARSKTMERLGRLPWALLSLPVLLLSALASASPVAEDAAGKDPDPMLVFAVGEEKIDPAGLSRVIVSVRGDVDDRTLEFALLRLRDGRYDSRDPIEIAVARSPEGARLATLDEAAFRLALFSDRAKGNHQMMRSWFHFRNRGAAYVSRETRMHIGTVIGHRRRELWTGDVPVEEVFLELPTGTRAWIARAPLEKIAILVPAAPSPAPAGPAMPAAPSPEPPAP